MFTRSQTSDDAASQVEIYKSIISLAVSEQTVTILHCSRTIFLIAVKCYCILEITQHQVDIMLINPLIM